ncbi:hypothetical protein [Methylocucumis oryzae]|nr:hypothetical protein [Methylocucumis oryzae]
MNALSNFRWSFLCKLIGLMFVYTLISYYSLIGFPNSSHINMISLINGIALAVHIIGGKKFLPSFFFALLASGLWANHSVPLSLTYALGYTLANFAGFKLFQHYCPQNMFR